MSAPIRRRLPTVSGGSPPRQHAAAPLHPGGSDKLGTDSLGFVNGGSSCGINAIAASLLRVPPPQRASGPHPFVSHYLDPSIMVTQPRTVSAEFARLTHALHADRHRVGGIESGVLAAPAPLCTAQLRAALASYAADVGAHDHFSAVGPADAAYVAELMLRALHDQWHSQELVAHAPPEVKAAQAAAELVAQAVVAPYPPPRRRTSGPIDEFAHGLWLRVPSTAPTEAYTVTLQRLLTQDARTTLPTVYTVEAAREGALSDLCAILLKVAKLADGTELAIYSVVDGQLWERLPPARALAELHVDQTIMAFEVAPTLLAASCQGVWRDGIPLVHRTQGRVVADSVPTLLQSPSTTGVGEDGSGNLECWLAKLHSLAWRVVAERWVEGLPRGDSRMLPTSGCELKVMVRHVVGEGVSLSALSQPTTSIAADGEAATADTTCLSMIGTENLIIVADWRCDSAGADKAEDAKHVCGVLEPWSVLAQSRMSASSSVARRRQPVLQDLLDNAMQEQQQQQQQGQGQGQEHHERSTVNCRIGHCVCGDTRMRINGGGSARMDSSLRCNAYPLLLCLHLGRYLKGKDGSILKRNTLIDCPLQGLKLSHYEYELFAVVDLLGDCGQLRYSGTRPSKREETSSAAGHFVATVRVVDRNRDRSPDDEREHHSWVCFDDTRVRACNAPSVSSDSYILFYLRTGSF